MEDFLEQNPCVRLIAPFIIGIIIGSLFSVPIKVSVTITVIAIGIAIWLYNRLLKYTQRWLPGFVSGIAIFAVGMLLITTHQNCQTDEPTTRTVDQYRACVLNPPALKNRYYKTELQIEAANISGSWYSIDTKITATIERDSLAENLKAGQTIEFAAQIDSLNAPKNPFGFDYANYLQNNGIHGSIFLKSGKWQIVSAEVRGISRYALNIRQRLIGLFKDAGLSGNELGLASTLVLGYKNDIDSEVKQAYMNAGAMHVLAVSGMHVGIVYMALDLLMIVFGGKRFNWLKQLLIILLLWAYAFITGLSPSVTRATIMFTVVIFGKVFNRDTSVYNSLAFAALCILVYDPSMLFKPSFQLSCVAVTGIVFYQPRIARIINVKNKALNYLWQLTSVSIAAQIATLPFCLYYFERTPVYFWLSNIIVSPGATVLIVLAMLLLITSPINCISIFFGFLTKWATKAMNFLVITIANLPGSTIENTHIAVIQAIAIGITIVLITSWLISKRYGRLLAAISILTLVVIIPLNMNKITHSERQAICIYHNTQISAIQFVDGNNSYWLSNIPNNQKMSPLIKGGNQYWSACRHKMITENTCDAVIYDDSFFVFDSICGIIVNDSTKRFGMSEPLELDYLIVQGNPTIKARQMPKNLSFKHVIIEASVKPWIASEWEKKYSGCHVYNIKREGAYVCEWQRFRNSDNNK